MLADVTPHERDQALSRCPLCHTDDHYALAAGGHWRCGRCGHVWTKTRLATVEAYMAWVTERALP